MNGRKAEANADDNNIEFNAVAIEGEDARQVKHWSRLTWGLATQGIMR